MNKKKTLGPTTTPGSLDKIAYKYYDVSCARVVDIVE